MPSMWNEYSIVFLKKIKEAQCCYFNETCIKCINEILIYEMEIKRKFIKTIKITLEI